jgi:hypothetical protein
MRFLFRFASLVFLVAASMVGIIDSIQSVAGESVLLTSFGSALFALNPEIVASSESYFDSHLPPFLWKDVLDWLLLQPAFVVFLGFSLLLWVIAFKRAPAAGRFAA